MIFLVAALPCEARPLIRHFHLSRAEGSLPVFTGDEITLIETGTGPLSAAAMTAALLSRSPLRPSDFLINLGICAGLFKEKRGAAFLIHRLSDLSSGRDYYPDILAASIHAEARLFTGAGIYEAGKTEVPAGHGPAVYDMEGAAVFHAASLFLAPHQMRFLKIVSDQGGELPDASAVSAMIEAFLPQLEREIEAMKLQCSFPQTKEPDTEDIAALFCPSLSMQRQIHQLVLYCELAGIAWRPVIERYRRDQLLPARNKEEGKKRLEEVRDELLA